MFKRKIAGFVSLFFCIILSGCTQASVISSPETLGPINTIAPTLAPTITKEPTPGYIQYYCPDIAPTSDLQNVGIVYRDTLDDKTYLWNTDTDQRTIISEEGFTQWGYAMTSKDHQYIAYFADSYDGPYVLLKVVDAKGKVINTFVKKGNEWWKLIHWRGHELMISYYFNDRDPYRIQVFDPFSGRSTRVTPDFPNISIWELYTWDVSGLNKSVYDESLKYVVYYTNDQDVVLYDIDNKKDLWQKHDFFPYTAPVWSPNDQNIVLELNKYDSPNNIDHNEMYILNKSGILELYTDFDSAYESMRIKQFAWSENGRYVSFIFNSHEADPEFESGILDAQTGEVSFYCIQTNYDYRSSAVWLADNENIIMNGFDENNIQVSYLVDIKSHEISILGTNMVTYGWVVDE